MRIFIHRPLVSLSAVTTPSSSSSSSFTRVHLHEPHLHKFGSVCSYPCQRRSFHHHHHQSMAMSSALIDVDCNLWHRDLQTLQGGKELVDNDKKNDPWNILKEDAIEAANVVAMLSPSSTIAEAQKGLSLLREYPPPIPIKTTVGIHPYHVNDNDMLDVSMDTIQRQKIIIMDLLQENKDICAAVGECGLDASEGFPPLDNQIPIFQLQVDIAQNLGLPLFVHERLAFDETMDILKDVTVPVLTHCFTGTKSQCQQYIDRGYSVSISGYILKDTNDNCNEVAACLSDGIIPLDKLMIETDAPYMGFANCRELYLDHNQEFVSSLNAKKRKRLQQSIYPNVPSSLPMVLKRVVECLQVYYPDISTDDIARQTTSNARTFFGL